MADLATIDWIEYSERVDAANHPEGYPDIFNRPNRTIWDVFCTEHNKDGTHKAGIAGEFQIVDCNMYVGDGTNDRQISLTYLSACTIDIVMIFSEEKAATYWGWTGITEASTPTAHDGWTKPSNGDSYIDNFDKIQDIANDARGWGQAGYFEVGTDDATNKNGVTYYYVVWGYAV